MQAMVLQGCQAGSLRYLQLSSYPTNLLGLQSSECNASIVQFLVLLLTTAGPDRLPGHKILWSHFLPPLFRFLQNLGPGKMFC